MSQKWKFEDINWSLFDPSKVNPEILALIKAGSVIEHNGTDYGRYLGNVFEGDKEFGKEIEPWAKDEVKHGKVLAQWVKMADPDFDFDERFKMYVKGYPIDTETKDSIRGSRASELLSRCMVEIGTSSFYSAIKDATDEPLLKHICAKIAADELRHYKLFYIHMKRYQAQEKLNFVKRFRVTMTRLMANQADDELPFAYYVANEETRPYTRDHYTKVYSKLVYKCYQKSHVTQGMGLFCKALGVKPQGWLHKFMSFVVYETLSSKAVKYAKKV